MKAIVLTFDKQAGFAELTYKKYMTLWENCPLEFLIPVNNKEEYQSYDFFKSCNNVELIESKSDIRSTMKTLLSGINDDDWVYWCIDDRFPTEIIDKDLLNNLFREIESGKLDHLNGLKLFRWHEDISEETMLLANNIFHVQRPKGLFGFWLHSFVKAKVLRKIFLSDQLNKIYKISDITTYFHNKPQIDVFQKTVIPQNNIILMGEPCIEGEITVNGYKELKENSCPIPSYKITNQIKEFLHRDTSAYKKVNHISDVVVMSKKRSYTHIVNPVGVPVDSDFYRIQMVTFEAMKQAWDNRGNVNVELMSVQYEEDHAIIPNYFNKTPNLKDSVLHVNEFTKKRKLPFIDEIFQRALKYSKSDYIIFTNVDIIPDRNFYKEIDKLVEAGNVAFTINRRTVNRYPDTPDKLSEIQSQEGGAHPGHDCFIFPRLWIEKFVLGRVIVGAPWVGFSILANMACVGRGINIFQDLKLTRHLGDDQQWMSKENLEYRNFNSYEALNLLAELQKQYGAFSPGGYLAQHVTLAINQVKSAGTLVKYLRRRYELSSNDTPKRKLVFSISSGRAGSEYLKTILGSALNVKSFHEPEPSMSGTFLMDSMINPLITSYEKRLEKVKKIKEVISHFPPSTIYAETNHMFIKTFYDVILENFKDCDIYVIVLRRALDKVLASFIKMGYFTEKNNAWPHWMHKVPSVNSLLKPIMNYEEMDQYDRAIAYLLDIEMRAREFIKMQSENCFIREVNLDDIQTFEQVENLFDFLGLSATPYTYEVVGEVVNARKERKEGLNIDTNLEYCADRIRQFLKVHREAGIKIPKLPQFE